MIDRLLNLFRRHRPVDLPETPATLKAQEVGRQMEATTSRIDTVLADLDRIEFQRRSRKTGNWMEGSLTPERLEEQP